MYGHYRQISEKELEQIRNSQKLQENLIYSDSSELPYGEYLCIGVYWQAIDFLIMRSQSRELYEASPLKNIVFGGEPLNKNEDIWFDFGPIRYFLPEQVREIVEHTNKITPEDLAASYDQALLVEHMIHPADFWWTQDQIDVINEIKEYYSELLTFFRKAAICKKYIITYVTA